MFLLFFGNIHRDVRCPEGWLARPGQQDKTYNPGNALPFCCQKETGHCCGRKVNGKPYNGRCCTSPSCCRKEPNRWEVSKLSGLGGGLAYVGLSSKYDRNMSGSCTEISWICFFVTGICNWVQIFWGIKSKFEKKILLSSLQRWISQGSLANAQAQTHTRFQRIVPYQVSNHHN